MRSSRRNKTYAMVQTDRMEGALKNALSDLYRDAGRDIAKMSKDFARQFSAADDRMRDELTAGRITESYYKTWRKTQISKGERWNTMRDQMADRMKNADLQAQAYINSKAPEIYALNHDYTCFQIDKAGIMEGRSFTLTNERAVRELVLGGNHVNFRTVRINPIRDYEWNQQRIQRIVTRGILSGKSIDGIAADFMGVMKNNESAAIRNARTAVTSAQAAGCQEAFDEAADMGIELEKEWIATYDNRTRDSHTDMDGKRVAIDDVFPNGLRYPGDPDGEPCEVYNCRCTMRAILPHMRGSDSTAVMGKMFADWRDAYEELE